MKTYRLHPDLVPRDIGGIYFLVDIGDKHYYDRRRIQATNRTAFLLVTLMRDLETFTEEELIQAFSGLFAVEDEEQAQQIRQDVLQCLETLRGCGYVTE